MQCNEGEKEIERKGWIDRAPEFPVDSTYNEAISAGPTYFALLPPPLIVGGWWDPDWLFK
jgi:hypothetical protein